MRLTAPKWNWHPEAETVSTSPGVMVAVTPLVSVGGVPLVQAEQNDDGSIASLYVTSTKSFELIWPCCGAPPPLFSVMLVTVGAVTSALQDRVVAAVLPAA